MIMLPVADSTGGGEKQNMEVETDVVNDRTLLATVDNTLLQTLQDHMIQCSPTPYTHSWLGVLCFEDDSICLGQALLNSPVIIIDGSADNSIMSHIALGSFPNSSPTSSYIMYRHHIGLVIPYMVVMMSYSILHRAS